MIGRGVAETGLALAEGVGRVGNWITGTDHVDLERLGARRTAMQERLGAPETLGEKIAYTGSRIGSEVGSYLIPGVGASKLARWANPGSALARILNPTSFAGRIGRDALVGAPITGALAASSPENSATGGIAEALDSERLRAIAEKPAGRVAGDFLLDLLGGTLVESGISGVRAFRNRGAIDTPLGDLTVPPRTVEQDPLPRLMRPRSTGDTPAGLLRASSSAREMPTDVFVAGPEGVRAPLSTQRALPAEVRDAAGNRIPDQTSTRRGERVLYGEMDPLERMFGPEPAPKAAPPPRPTFTYNGPVESPEIVGATFKVPNGSNPVLFKETLAKARAIKSNFDLIRGYMERLRVGTRTLADQQTRYGSYFGGNEHKASVRLEAFGQALDARGIKRPSMAEAWASAPDKEVGQRFVESSTKAGARGLDNAQLLDRLKRQEDKLNAKPDRETSERYWTAVGEAYRRGLVDEDGLPVAGRGSPPEEIEALPRAPEVEPDLDELAAAAERVAPEPEPVLPSRAEELSGDPQAHAMRARIAEIDKVLQAKPGARDAYGGDLYQGLLSTSGKHPLRKGETWRDRAISVADSMDRITNPPPTAAVPPVDQKALDTYTRPNHAGENSQYDVDRILGRPDPKNQALFDAAEAARLGTRGFASREAIQSIAGAGAGAIGGAALDEENRVRGAAVGAALGAGSVAAARSAFGGSSRAVPIPPNLRAAYQRAEGSVDFSGELGKAAQKGTAEPFTTRFDRFLDKLANAQGPIERLGRAVDDKLKPTQNPRDLLTFWRNADSTIHRAFRSGVVDPVTQQKIGPSFEDIVKPFEGDPEAIRQAFTYAVQERLVGRGLEGFGGNVQKFDDAQKLVAHFRSVPQMQQFRQTLKSYTDALGQYAVKTGLWTPEQWKAIEASDVLYIPTQRIQSALGVDVPGATSGGGLMNIGAGVKKFTGSQKDIYDPATALAEYTAAIIKRADSYRVGHSVIEAVQKLGPAGELILTPVKRSGAPASVSRGRAARGAKNLRANLPPAAVEAIDELMPTRVDAKNPVIWRNVKGKREEYIVNSPDLLTALGGLQKMDHEGLRKLLDYTLLPLRRIFTAATTGLAPAFFAVTNPARDVVELAAKTESKVGALDIAKGFAHGIGGAAGKSRFADQMNRFGLGNVSIWHDAAHTTARQYQREIAPTTVGQKVRGAARKTGLRYSGITVLEAAGNATEVGPRLAESMASMRKNQPRVGSGEWAIEDLLLRAGTEGREKIDFVNQPGSQLLQDLRNYIPFFNAALQGSTTMAKATARNPKRVAGVASAIATTTAVAWALKHRSPEILATENDRLPAERASYLFFPLGADGRFTVRLPLPQEFGIIAAGVTAGLDAALDEDPKGVDVLIQSINRALPPGVGELLIEGNVTAPVPGLQQLVENAKNKRDYDDAPVVPQGMQGLPAGERRRDTTPYTADLLAAGVRGVGRMMPGEGNRLENTSPLQMENIMRGVTSRFTPFVTAATDPIAQRMLGREEAPPRVPAAMSRNPVNPVSAVLANPSPSTTASEQRFYRTRERVQEGETAIRRAIAQQDRGLAERTIEDYADVLSPEVRQIVQVAYDEAGAMTQAAEIVRTAFQQGEIDEARARTLLDRINERSATIFRMADDLIAGQQRSSSTTSAALPR